MAALRHERLRIYATKHDFGRARS